MYGNNINDRISRLAFRQFPSKHSEGSHTVVLVLRNEVGVSEKKTAGQKIRRVRSAASPVGVPGLQHEPEPPGLGTKLCTETKVMVNNVLITHSRVHLTCPEIPAQGRGGRRGKQW